MPTAMGIGLFREGPPPTWKLRDLLFLSSSRTPGMVCQMYLVQKVMEGYSKLPLSSSLS